MKLLRRALDCHDPRSLWHRSVCQCLYQSVGSVVVLGGVFAAIALFAIWVTHFIMVALVPLLVLPAINLGLDDSNATLAQFMRASEIGGHLLLPWPLLAGVDWIALCLSLLAPSFYYQWHGRWTAACWALVAPLLLLPVAPTLIVFVLSFCGGALFVGFVGSIGDFIALFTTINRQSKQVALSHILPVVVSLLYSGETPFYTLVAATAVLLGASAGLCLVVLIIVLLPLYGIVTRCRQDVAETIHDLDV